MGKYNSNKKYNYPANQEGLVYNEFDNVPIISGEDTDLGERKDNFAISYTVTDLESPTIAVKEYVDGVETKSFLANSGEVNFFTIPVQDWDALDLTQHTFSIEANDGVNTVVTRIYTFTKIESTETEMYIGYVDDKDKAFQYFMPLGMKYSVQESNFPIMPAAETTYVEMPNADGSIPEFTVYKNRPITIVAWSEPDLTNLEKSQLKEDITNLLDKTKHKPMTLINQDASLKFKVKYTGELNIQEAPTFIKATIPLQAFPYANPFAEQVIYGSGTITNRGNKSASIVNYISGGCVNPSFSIGNTQYTWNGTVGTNQTLIIDHSKMTCRLENLDGTRENALNNLKGEFLKIPVGTDVELVASESTKNFLKTEVTENILWKVGEVIG